MQRVFSVGSPCALRNSLRSSQILTVRLDLRVLLNFPSSKLGLFIGSGTIGGRKKKSLLPFAPWAPSLITFDGSFGAVGPKPVGDFSPTHPRTSASAPSCSMRRAS